MAKIKTTSDPEYPITVWVDNPQLLLASIESIQGVGLARFIPGARPILISIMPGFALDSIIARLEELLSKYYDAIEII